MPVEGVAIGGGCELRIILLMPSNDFLRLEELPNSNRMGPDSLGPFQSLRGLVPLVVPSGEAGLLVPLDSRLSLG